MTVFIGKSASDALEYAKQHKSALKLRDEMIVGVRYWAGQFEMITLAYLPCFDAFEDPNPYFSIGYVGLKEERVSNPEPGETELYLSPTLEDGYGYVNKTAEDTVEMAEENGLDFIDEVVYLTVDVGIIMELEDMDEVFPPLIAALPNTSEKEFEGLSLRSKAKLMSIRITEFNKQAIGC